jgi:class 3 adenylate cyclase
MSSLTFFSLQKKLLVLVLSTTFVSISITTVLFLNFDNITIFQFQENFILIGIFLMFVMSILTYFLSKRLSGPLAQLSAATHRISQGDFSVRTNIKSRDEIGDLSESFDYMVTKLQEAEITIKQKEEVIKQQEDILLKFSQHTQNDCVGVIDMKDSTKISAKLSDEDVTKLYEIFLNFMAKIVRNYNGEVVKNIGDALMFRFPNTDLNDDLVMKNILECCLNMIESRGELKKQLEVEKMPELNYKISISYGSVKVAQSSTSTTSDIFGPTVNRCFKINSLCPENSLIIDNNLHNVLKNFEEYNISQLSETEINKKYGYTIFQVKRMTGL